MPQPGGPPGRDPRNNLRLLRSHGMAVLDDKLYVDSGRYFMSSNSSKTQDLDAEEDWIPNPYLFSIDLQNSLSSLTFESIKSRINVHDKGNKPNNTSGAIVADGISSSFIFHMGGLLDPKIAPGHFWTYTQNINDFHTYFRAPNSTLKRYDGAAVASQYKNKVYYQGGVGPQGLTSGELTAINMENGESDMIAKGDPVSGSVLAWMPFGEEGVLVSIGGVDADGTARSMDSVAVFDIKSARWFTQTVTKGDHGLPNPRKRFCAVTPRYYSADGKLKGIARDSFEIIIRGGTAIDTSDNARKGTEKDRDNNFEAFDDIWALSLPTFTWIRYYEGLNSTSATEKSKSQRHYERNQTCALIHDTYLTWLGTATPGEMVDSDVIGFFDITNPLSYKNPQGTARSKRGEGELPYDSGKRTYSVPAVTRDVVAGKISPAAGWTGGLEEVFNKRIEDPSGSNAHRLGTGAKAGIILGVIILVILLISAALWSLKVFHARRRSRKRITMPILPPKPKPSEWEQGYQELGGEPVSELQSAETLATVASWRQEPIELPSTPSNMYQPKVIAHR